MTDLGKNLRIGSILGIIMIAASLGTVVAVGSVTATTVTPSSSSVTPVNSVQSPTSTPSSVSVTPSASTVTPSVSTQSNSSSTVESNVTSVSPSSNTLLGITGPFDETTVTPVSTTLEGVVTQLEFELGNITVIKQTNPDGSTQAFNFTGDLGNFTLTDGQNVTFTVPSGIYNVTELVPFGWFNFDRSCSFLEFPQVSSCNTNPAPATIEVNLGAGGNVLVEFGNEDLDVQTGNITIAKETIPDNSTQLFNFTVIGGPTTIGNFTLGDGQNVTFTDIAPGNYTFLEIVPDGWNNSERGCSGDGIVFVHDPDRITFTISEIHVNQTFICTFTNTEIDGDENSPPVAVDDSYVTAFGESVSGNLLANDTDADGDALRVATITSPPAHGVVVVQLLTGNFTYTPNAGFSGVDTFRYKANDGTDDSNVANVTITVIPNTPPVANNDSYVTDFGVPISGNLGDNDTDADGDALQFSITSPPSHGVVVLQVLTGNFTYTPNAGFTGVDQFSYKVNDGFSDSNIANVTVTVRAMTVDIDIKPNGGENALNLKKDKVITVAILGNSAFNVNNIDVSPLSDAPKFGGTTPKAPIRTSYQDVNNDGFMDLVLQYRLAQLGFTNSSTEGCISGKLTNGTAIEGCDSVKIVPK